MSQVTPVGTCNCLWGTPKIINGVCTCVNATTGTANQNPNVPPHPTAPAPSGYVWQFDNTAHQWVLTPTYVGNVNYPNGIAPHQSLIQMNNNLGNAIGSTLPLSLRNLFTQHKTLAYLGAAGIAYYFLSKK